MSPFVGLGQAGLGTIVYLGHWVGALHKQMKMTPLSRNRPAHRSSDVIVHQTPADWPRRLGRRAPVARQSTGNLQPAARLRRDRCRAGSRWLDIDRGNCPCGDGEPAVGIAAIDGDRLAALPRPVSRRGRRSTAVISTCSLTGSLAMYDRIFKGGLTTKNPMYLAGFSSVIPPTERKLCSFPLSGRLPRRSSSHRPRPDASSLSCARRRTSLLTLLGSLCRSWRPGGLPGRKSSERSPGTTRVPAQGEQPHQGVPKIL